MGESSGLPILVTGSHRSGSTWAGKMIATSSKVGYIWEPLNPKHKRGIFGLDTKHFYTYIADHNGLIYERAMRRTLAFQYSLAAQSGTLRSARDVAEMAVAWSRSCRYRVERRRALLKDPLALFAAEWIASKFDAHVVVMIRHPAAFVNSLIKASFRHRFSNFLEQSELMSDQLAPFEDEIQRHARIDCGIVDDSILLWRITHHVIAKYRQLHPDWLFIRHEDLSRDPVIRFEPVFAHLGLAYTPSMRRKIEVCTCPGNPLERPGEGWPPFARLDSRRNVDRWMTRLTADQINRIRHDSEDVWRNFYTEDDWNPEAASRHPVTARAIAGH
jgi:hypothetical protein